ncbi:MAG: glycosyltransferase family 92 protein, partial [Fusobacteriaceae bacterium]
MNKKLKTENNNFIFDRPIEINFKYIIKRILLVFMDIFYHLLLMLVNKKEKEKKKYYATICGIFKNEASYMKEWIEYHKMIGVQHFYLYNNFSEDNYKEILEPYIKEGVVTLKEWPVKAGQMSAYKDCYENYKSESQWICFLDFDEFICPYEEKNICDWLKKFERYPSIVIYWKMFGTSGKINREKKLITEELTVSWEKLVDIGKVFFNTEFVIVDFVQMHTIKAQLKIINKKIKIPSMN